MRPASVEIRFTPRWELVDASRQFLLRFFEAALAGDAGAAGVAERCALAAHELLENAVKYSPDVETRIACAVDAAGGVRVTVENVPRPEHLPTLLAELRAAIDAPDPFAW
jgi:hypothetical protein